MYAEGHGVPKDYEKAFIWFEKAAEQNNILALYNLGLMYRDGQGVAQNNKKSYIMLSLAAIAGVTPAVQERDAVSKKLTPRDLKQAKAEIQKRTSHP